MIFGLKHYQGKLYHVSPFQTRHMSTAVLWFKFPFLKIFVKDFLACVCWMDLLFCLKHYQWTFTMSPFSGPSYVYLVTAENWASLSHGHIFSLFYIKLIFTGDIPQIVSWCHSFNDTERLMKAKVDLSYDPTAKYHDYKIKFSAQKDDVVNVGSMHDIIPFNNWYVNNLIAICSISYKNMKLNYSHINY